MVRCAGHFFMSSPESGWATVPIGRDSAELARAPIAPFAAPPPGHRTIFESLEQLEDAVRGEMLKLREGRLTAYRKKNLEPG